MSIIGLTHDFPNFSLGTTSSTDVDVCKLNKGHNKPESVISRHKIGWV